MSSQQTTSQNPSTAIEQDAGAPDPQREADEQRQREGGSRTYPGPGLESVPARPEGYRRAAIRESRIKDRPYKGTEDSINIKIELDLEVEVSLDILLKFRGRSGLDDKGGREGTERCYEQIKVEENTDGERIGS